MERQDKMNLDRTKLEQELKTRWAARNLRCYDEVDSTNLEMIRLAKEGAPHGTLVVADSQSAGKGRLGRKWVSPKGTGIWMSILLRPDIAPQSASMLTLVAALAVVKGIDCETGLPVQIKWPNDVVLGGRKLCGILTEMSTEAGAIRYVVPGIGVNVNMTEFPPEVSETATSLRLELGREIEREPLIARMMEAFEGYYEKFLKTQDLAGLTEEYNRRSVNLGRQVKVLDPAGNFQGEAMGIASQGSLLVKMADGQVCQVISGEVSVRGVYGYAL